MSNSHLHAKMEMIAWILSGCAVIAAILIWTGLELHHKRSEELQQERALLLCAPDFRADVTMLLRELETYGYHPVVLDTWRTKRTQERLFRLGLSEVATSRHNETTAEGLPASTALDLRPLSKEMAEEHSYEVLVACLAHKYNLETGIEWGLGDDQRLLVHDMVMHCRYTSGQTGWDPLHIQLVRQSRGEPAIATVANSTGIDFEPDRQPERAAFTVYCDFQSPYCASLYHLLTREMNQTDFHHLSLRFKQFPLEEFPMDRVKAEFADCMLRYDDKHFTPFQGYLYAHPSDSEAISIALHLSTPFKRRNVEKCVKDGLGSRMVDLDIRSGQKDQLSGIPTLFIGDTRLEGARDLNTIRSAINEFGLSHPELNGEHLKPH